MGLLHKSSLTGENFFDSNGNPIPGTPFYYHLQQKIDESYQQGYQAGVKFVLDNFENRLKLALYARIDEFKALPPLPDYCKFLNIAMKYIAKAFAVMKFYCNIAPSRINIEATFCKFWLGIEQDLELLIHFYIVEFLMEKIIKRSNLRKKNLNRFEFIIWQSLSQFPSQHLAFRNIMIQIQWII